MAVASLSEMADKQQITVQDHLNTPVCFQFQPTKLCGIKTAYFRSKAFF